MGVGLVVFTSHFSGLDSWKLPRPKEGVLLSSALNFQAACVLRLCTHIRVALTVLLVKGSGLFTFEAQGHATKREHVRCFSWALQTVSRSSSLEAAFSTFGFTGLQHQEMLHLDSALV